MATRVDVSVSGGRQPVESVGGGGRRNLPALDGLRALSVAAVVAFHLGYLRGGFLGVDVFFAISGFLITRLLVDELDRTGTVSLRRFWVRRFRRLVPALLVVLVAVMVASRAWLASWRLTGLRSDALSVMAYAANWRFTFSGQSYFEQGVGPSPLRHTWSLAIEEQFYLAWPLVVLGAVWVVKGRSNWIPRRVIGVVAAALALASGAWMVVVAGSADDLSRVYYGTDTRAFALCGGAWLATWWNPWLERPESRVGRRRRARAAARFGPPALIGLVVLVVLVAEDDPSSYRWAFQLAAVLAIVAVGAVATREGTVSRWLALEPLPWLGRRSYGIYLWSWPIQVLAVDRFALNGIVLATVVVLGSVGLAALSYALVEEPIRRGRLVSQRPSAERTPRAARRRVDYGVSSIAVVAVIALVVATTAGAPDAPALLQVSDEEAAAAALRPAAGGSPGALGETASTAPRSVEATATGARSSLGPGPIDPAVPLLVSPAAATEPASDAGGPLRVLVTGDSVAWSLVSFVDVEDLDAAVSFDNRAIIGCGTMPPDARWIAGGNAPQPYFEFCDKQAEADLLGLRGDPDVVLFWIGAWELFDHDWRGTRYEVGTDEAAALVERQIQVRLDAYESAGVPTVMSLVGCFGAGPAVFGTEREDPERVRWLNDRIRAVAERNRGWVRTIDPTDTLCDADGAALRTIPGGEVMRTDGAHFESASATWLWNTWLAGQVGAALQPAS